MNTLRDQTLACVACIILSTTAPLTKAADHFISPVDFWFYLDNGADPGTAWQAPDFSHFDWNFGISQIGFGDGDEFTELNPFTVTGPLKTAYFRTRFNVENPALYSNVTIRLLRDDGGIVYMNGAEVFRSNMPTGAVNYATPAIRLINGADESSPAQRVVPATFLDSINTIAVEIHQAAGDTEDMSFSMEMIGHRIGENQPPSAFPSFVTVEQGKSQNIVLSAADPDQNPLTYTLLSFPQHGFLSGEGGNLTYTPDPGYLGADLFAFRASDGQWHTEEAHVSIEVVPPSNRPPTAQAQNLTVDEDTALSLTLGATDPDGDTLTYSYTSPAHGTLSGAGDTFAYQPALNYHGPDSFTFTANDGNGGTSTAIVSLSVLPINDLPVVTPQIVQVDEDNSIAITLTAVDVDGDALAYSSSAPTHGTLIGTGANLTYQPSPDFFGQASFSVSVSDGVSQTTATVSIAVRPVNDAPSAHAKAAPAQAPERSSRNLFVLAGKNQLATVILDGAGSSDIDSQLTPAWFINADSKPLSTALSPVITLPLGEHRITLQVSDGQLSASDTITVRVMTATEMIRMLIAAMEACPMSPGERNSPLHSLRTAYNAFAGGNTTAGIDALAQFQRRVLEKLQDPAMAKHFSEEAQRIVDLAKAAAKVPAASRPRGQR